MKNILMMFALIGVLVLTGGMDISYADPSTPAAPKIDTSTPEAPKMNTLSNEEVPLLTGKVVETMDISGYTYIKLEQDGKSIWAALPITKVTVGQEVTIQPGFAMKNFESKTLDRTFETIVFSGGVVGGEKKITPPSSDVMPKDSTHGMVIPEPSSALMPKDDTHKMAISDKNTEVIKVEKAEGPDAYTVAELHAKRGELDTKSIVLKGQVIKVTQAIMGKNWVHIQDGSGIAMDGSNDITVTTQDVPEVGSVVTVKGTLSKDKDFTMGYFYAVIIEDASIK